MRKRYISTILWAILVCTLVLMTFGCADKSVETQQQPVITAAQNQQPTSSAPENVDHAIDVKLAMITAGPIQDADYNTLGYVAMNKVAGEYKIDVAFTENAAVADQERITLEYIDQGFSIIWCHSSIYLTKALEMAAQYPDIVFIVEQDATSTDMLPNVWYIERNYYKGFYVSGAAAALASKTGNIGYVGALDLPFQRSIMNVMQQAIDELGLNTKIHYVYTGGFDDTLKAKQAAEGLIAKGCDVLVSGQNMGNFGIFTAARDAKNKVLIITQYTDKIGLAPENVMTSEIFNFDRPLIEIVGRIIKGEKGGTGFPLEYGEGLDRYTVFPLQNVSDELNARVKQISDDVASGKIVPIKDLDELKIK